MCRATAHNMTKTIFIDGLAQAILPYCAPREIKIVWHVSGYVYPTKDTSLTKNTLAGMVSTVHVNGHS